MSLAQRPLAPNRPEPRDESASLPSCPGAPCSDATPTRAWILDPRAIRHRIRQPRELAAGRKPFIEPNASARCAGDGPAPCYDRCSTAAEERRWPSPIFPP